MAIELNYDLKMSDGRPISAMSRIINQRTKELGETTKQSAIAMTINILKSLRADTKIAKIKGKFTIQNVDGKYYPSYSREGGVYKRVLRNGKNGPIVVPELKVAWKSQKGQKEHTYHVIDSISENKTFECLIVAPDVKTAKETISSWHEKKVKQHRGLAKIALGMAMHEVHEAETVSDSVTADTMKIATECVEGTVNETGFNNGNVNIMVHDKIDYAGDALKHGPNYVQTAVQKTMNKMTAYLIHRLHDKGIQTDLQIPYPELKGNTAQ